jgi:hypothetical protein
VTAQQGCVCTCVSGTSRTQTEVRSSWACSNGQPGRPLKPYVACVPASLQHIKPLCSAFGPMFVCEVHVAGLVALMLRSSLLRFTSNRNTLFPVLVYDLSYVNTVCDGCCHERPDACG